MRIGLIAGNGKFPFLVLEAAKSLGHDVTVVAIKDEAYSELESLAARGRFDDLVLIKTHDSHEEIENKLLYGLDSATVEAGE